MTLNMMFRYPDLYHTGMAIAFISNQRFYDTIYQERFMGLSVFHLSAVQLVMPVVSGQATDPLSSVRLKRE